MDLDQAFARVISERQASILRPAAQQLATLVKEYGFAHVYVFPSLDAGIAASLLVSVLARFGARYAIKYTPVPPGELDAPSVLLGYPANVVFTVTPRKPSLLLGQGEKPQGILSMPVASFTDSSTAAVTVGVLSELTILGAAAAYALSAGFWLELDRGRRGEFTGLEASVIEVLGLEKLVEHYFTVKLVEWAMRGTEEAISLTWLPYLPGLTENIEEARRLLSSDPRLSKLIGQRLEDAQQEAVAVLGEKLYELVKKESKGPRRPTEIIGSSYYSYRLPISDLREAAAALACYASSHGLSALLGLPAHPLTAAVAYALFRLRARGIAARIEEARSRGGEAVRALGASMIALPRGDCDMLVEHELRRLGIIRRDQAALFVDGEGRYVVLESVAALLGIERVRELLAEGCLVYEGDTPYARLSQQC